MVVSLLDPSSVRKNKISLTDYNYQKDIENRLLMARFTDKDLEVLEEILYSSLSIPLSKLSKNLDMELDELLPVLEHLSKSGLFCFEKESITVDKEIRKYFESHVQKFDEDFRPGMEFLQSLLKKVPIHVLPTWYSISRTSDNIFESLVEKHLLTPQIFQRYVMELNFGEPVLKSLIQDVYEAEGFSVSSEALMKKYNISRELFEEYMLHLEFSFVCCIGYQKNGDRWEEKVTPFYEWDQYLTFLKNTEVTSFLPTESIELKRPNDFSFVQDLTVILDAARKNPIALQTTSDGLTLPDSSILEELLPSFSKMNPDPSFYKLYVHTLITKATLVRLAHVIQGKLHTADGYEDWTEMRLDNKALYFYRHPRNKILSQETYTEKALREAEKSIVRVLGKGWVLFDDFLKGVHVPLCEDSSIVLKRFGKTWKYTIPEYTEHDCLLLKATVLDWLFEAGIVQAGTCNGKDCFRVTTLGQTLFAR